MAAMREQAVRGAPGVYLRVEEPLRALTGVRMDVAALVGVAPRGPSRWPALTAGIAAGWAEPPRGVAARSAALRSGAVAVESWDEYRRVFGGFEGPGLLPYAVAAFFENGGRRAYVVRIVHDYGEGDPANEQGTAAGDVPGVTPRGGGAFRLRARDEGSWGNRLSASLAFRTRPLGFDAATATGLTLPLDAPVGTGTLLRCWPPAGTPQLRFVSDARLEWSPERPVRRLVATLESPLGAVPERAEIVEMDLAVASALGGRGAAP